MFEIEKNIPAPRTYVGRKSKKRGEMIETMSNMEAGDSFRVEYKLASMRNFLRNSGVEGVFKCADDGDDFVRVWRVS